MSDLEYLAGIVDGEGSICLTKTRTAYRPSVFVEMTDRRPIDIIGAMLGIRVSMRGRGGNRKPTYRVAIHFHKAYDFLVLLAPHLRVKQNQALLAMQAHLIIQGDKHRRRGHAVGDGVKRTEFVSLLLEWIRTEIGRMNA